MLVDRSKYKSRYIDEPQRTTNADRIRAMSDEELAEFLVVANPTNCLDCAFSCGWRCQPDRQDYSDTEKCVEGKKRWLKQPAETTPITADTCVCCGAIIPEGQMVCPNCLQI